MYINFGFKRKIKYLFYLILGLIIGFSINKVSAVTYDRYNAFSMPDVDTTCFTNLTCAASIVETVSNTYNLNLDIHDFEHFIYYEYENSSNHLGKFYFSNYSMGFSFSSSTYYLKPFPSSNSNIYYSLTYDFKTNNINLVVSHNYTSNNTIANWNSSITLQLYSSVNNNNSITNFDILEYKETTPDFPTITEPDYTLFDNNPNYKKGCVKQNQKFSILSTDFDTFLNTDKSYTNHKPFFIPQVITGLNIEIYDKKAEYNINNNFLLLPLYRNYYNEMNVDSMYSHLMILYDPSNYSSFAPYHHKAIIKPGTSEVLTTVDFEVYYNYLLNENVISNYKDYYNLFKWTVVPNIYSSFTLNGEIDSLYYSIFKFSNSSVLTGNGKTSGTVETFLESDTDICFYYDSSMELKIWDTNIYDDINGTYDFLDIETNINTNFNQNNGLSYFENFNIDNFGLSSVVTLPLNFIQKINSGTCTPLTIPIPKTGKSIKLACMSNVYNNFPDILNIWHIVTFGIISYFVIIDIFRIVKNLRDPEEDKIEVIDL